jgi:hypothetical protein
VCFCGTVLTVTRTGRYPAGLAIGEPGLSSTERRFLPEGGVGLDPLRRFTQRSTVDRQVSPQGVLPLMELRRPSESFNPSL